VQQDAAYPTFLSRVLVMDEAFFTRNGILNTRNQHTWAYENPHSFQETRFQHQFAINVWAGIIGDLLRGPYELPPRLSGSSSLKFLCEKLPPLKKVYFIFFQRSCRQSLAALQSTTRKTASPIERAQCVVWFSETKSPIIVQRNYRRVSEKDPPDKKTIKGLV
jgi:hypothetical protein